MTSSIRVASLGLCETSRCRSCRMRSILRRQSVVVCLYLWMVQQRFVSAGRLAFGVASVGSPHGGGAFLHEAFVTTSRRNELLLVSSRTRIVSLQRMRGGAVATTHVDESESQEDSDSSVELDGGSDVEEEDENDKEQEENSTVIDSSPGRISTQPLALTVRTNIGNSILDQAMELNVNRSRNIASLKDSLRRQLPGRPPTAAMQLLFQGRRLADHVLVNELVDDEEEEEGEEDDEEGEEERSSKLVLTLDMVPPVDPKFVPQLELKIQELTASELLEAYAASEAAMYKNAELLMESAQAQDEAHANDEGDNEEIQSVSSSSSLSPPPLIGEEIREQTARIRRDLEQRLLCTDHAQELLSDPLAPSAAQEDSLQATLVRGNRVRLAAVSGVRTSLKRQVQHNLNIQWADSIRYFGLFLFFGWFGGRTPTSRAILLLGAPSVFVLQARPVKLWIKQVLYAILDNPPGIFLSLLPAPQQTLLSLDVQSAMKTIYGDFIVSKTSSLEKDRGENKSEYDAPSIVDQDEESEYESNDEDYDESEAE